MTSRRYEKKISLSSRWRGFTFRLFGSFSADFLTLLLLTTACAVLANGVDPDQLASEKANLTDLNLHCLSLNM